jgi:hypothetical protein
VSEAEGDAERVLGSGGRAVPDGRLMSDDVPDVEGVFREIAAAFARDPDDGDREMFRWMADRIEYHHDPPLPSDGLADKAGLRAGSTAELEVFRSAMPDFRIEYRPVRRDADQIVIPYRLRGTTESGQVVDFSGRMVAVVEDGLIRRLTAVIEGDPTILTGLLADRLPT